jgi:hypothetical protein
MEKLVHRLGDDISKKSVLREDGLSILSLRSKPLPSQSPNLSDLRLILCGSARTRPRRSFATFNYMTAILGWF